MNLPYMLRAGSPLMRRIILYTILFSSVITLALTSFQLYRHYVADREQIENNFQEIAISRLPAISESLWATDMPLLKMQLEGIRNLRDIHYLVLREGGETWAEAGQLTSKNIIRHDYPISYSHRNSSVHIGTLTVVATLDGVYSRLIDEALIVLASNALKTFLVAIFMLWLLYQLAGRHLTSLAQTMRRVDSTGLISGWRPQRSASRSPDEFDDVSRAFEHMARQLSESRAAQVRSESQIRNLVDQAGDGINLVDPDSGRIIDTNRQMSRMTGFTHADLTAKSIFDFAAPEQLSFVQAQLGRIKLDKSAVFERKFLRHDGSFITTEVNARLVEYGENRIIFSVVRDLTPRLNTEAALRASEQRFRDLAEMSSDWWWEQDKDFRFVQVSARIDHGGISQQAHLGKTRWELPETTPLNQTWEEHRALLQAHQPFSGLLLMRKSKSGINYLKVSGKPVFDMRGTFTGYRGVTIDITENKRVEEELKRSANLAQMLESVARAANQAATDEEALTACIKSVCEHGKWTVGHIMYLAGTDYGWNIAKSVWHFPDEALRARYSDAIMLTRDVQFIRGGLGFITELIFENRPQWVADLGKLHQFPRIRELRRLNLKSAFAFPIIVKDEVVACIEFFSEYPRSADDTILKASVSVAAQLARLVERQRAAAERNWLAAIVDNSNDAIASRTLDGIITSWNRGAEKLLGYSAQEAIGKSITLILPPEDQDNYIKNNEILLREAMIPARETRRVSKDGRRIDVLASAAAIRSEEGKIVGLAAIWHDITQIKQLKAEREQLAVIVENSGDAILSRELDDTITSWNWAAQKMFGWTREEMVNSREIVLTPPEREYERQQVRERLERGEDNIFLETTRLRKDGTPVEVEVTISAIRNSSGALERMAFIMRDVTARKWAAEALLESEARYRELYDGNPLPTLVIENNSNRILSFNRAALKKYEYTPDELMTMSIVDLQVPEDRAAVARELETRDNLKMNFHLRRHLTKSGQVIVAEVTASPNHYQGQPSRMVIVNDITEKKQAESALRDANTLLRKLSRRLVETQEAERRHIARELHDEVGQLLTALKIHLQIPQRVSATGRKDRIEECLQISDQILKRVRSLSLDLRPPQLDDIGLEAAIESQVQRIARPLGIAVELQSDGISGRFPVEIELACYRVAQEAIVNAVKHANAKHMNILISHSDGALKLTIRDDGAGFDTADARDRALRGTSMGLLNIEERISLLDGKFEITSEPGHGTLVQATFPLADPPQRPD